MTSGPRLAVMSAIRSAQPACRVLRTWAALAAIAIALLASSPARAMSFGAASLQPRALEMRDPWRRPHPRQRSADGPGHRFGKLDQHVGACVRVLGKASPEHFVRHALAGAPSRSLRRMHDAARYFLARCGR